MDKKIICKKNIIISVIILGLLIIALAVGPWTKGKKMPPKIVPVQQEGPKEPEIIFRNLPVEIKEKMAEEAKKIRAMDGIVDGINGRILKVKVGIGDLKGTTMRINVLASAKVGRTEIDKVTFVPSTVDSSFDKIKKGDRIIAWAKEDNIRDAKQFDSDYLEIIVE
jgi:hypothetical protein